MKNQPDGKLIATTTYNRDKQTVVVTRAEPSRAAPDAAAERLARFIAQKESLNCKTLDEAVHHQSKWQRIVPEAKEMLEAAYPDGAGHVVLLEACKGLLEELRLIRMKDTNAVYDPTIRVRAEAAIQQAERGQ